MNKVELTEEFGAKLYVESLEFARDAISSYLDCMASGDRYDDTVGAVDFLHVMMECWDPYGFWADQELMDAFLNSEPGKMDEKYLKRLPAELSQFSCEGVPNLVYQACPASQKEED